MGRGGFLELWSGEECSGGDISKKKKKIRVLDELRDTEGRVMSVLIHWGKIRYTFMCVYAPVDRRERKFFFFVICISMCFRIHC